MHKKLAEIWLKILRALNALIISDMAWVFIQINVYILHVYKYWYMYR